MNNLFISNNLDVCIYDQCRNDNISSHNFSYNNKKADHPITSEETFLIIIIMITLIIIIYYLLQRKA